MSHLPPAAAFICAVITSALYVLYVALSFYQKRLETEEAYTYGKPLTRKRLTSSKIREMKFILKVLILVMLCLAWGDQVSTALGLMPLL